MSLKSGIVGLPNVGKSSLFNAITKTQNAVSSNYPFCTIEPNIGRILVPDERLEKLAQIAHSEKTIFNNIEIMDIAGLVKGASEGKGLGNKFLSNIREVDAILHVVRCFDDDEIIHVENKIDPVFDASVIESELILADIDSILKIEENLQKRKAKEKYFEEKISTISKIKEILFKDEMLYINKDKFTEQELNFIKKDFFLLTIKPMIYIANLDENSIAKPDSNSHFNNLKNYSEKNNLRIIPICSKLEEEMSTFSEEERVDLLLSLDIKENGLAKIAKETYNILNLITFFTIGPKEARAWTIKKDAKAPEAAGEIHTDFQKGFIKAETISFEDYINSKGENGAKEAGKLRLESKEYIVKDGDVMHFKFNL